MVILIWGGYIIIYNLQIRKTRLWGFSSWLVDDREETSQVSVISQPVLLYCSNAPSQYLAQRNRFPDLLEFLLATWNTESFSSEQNTIIGMILSCCNFILLKNHSVNLKYQGKFEAKENKMSGKKLPYVQDSSGICVCSLHPITLCLSNLFTR